MVILFGLLTIVSLACWITVVVKVFQSGNVLMGVLSLCPLVAFIYGWVKSKELNAQTVMLIWTGAVVANFALQAAFGNPMAQTR